MSQRRRALLFLSCAALLPAQPRLQYVQWEPRVINATQTGSVTLNIGIVNAGRVEVLLNTGGAPVPLNSSGVNTLSASIPAAQLLAGYQTGDAHNFVGYLDVYDGLTRTRYNLIVNVRDDTMPFADVRILGLDVQRSRYVLNLRDDTLYHVLGVGVGVPAALGRRIYQYLSDDFDFIGIVGQVVTFQNRLYDHVRNNINGIGLTSQDLGSAWGSPRGLQGVINFPNDTLFDWAETGSLQQIGHRWCCYLNHPSLIPGRPQWPLSDAGYGVMGVSIGPTHDAGQFPYQLSDQGNGSFRLNPLPPATEFNNIELYLMGLGYPFEVPPLTVFRNQDQSTQSGVLQGPVDTLRLADIVAADGQRQPAATASQGSFRVATVVLSKDRLLTQDEMRFFDFMAGRGEEAREVAVRVGVANRSTTKPFLLATKGRAVLSTTVCLECEVSGVAPRFSPNGWANGASFVAAEPVAAGQILSLYGAGMGPASGVEMKLSFDGSIPNLLAGTRVLFDGVPATLIFSRSDVVIVVVPYAVAGQPRTTIQIEYQGRKSNTITVPVGATAPGIFAIDPGGRGRAAVRNQDGTINDPSSPALRGSYITIYATGEGQTNPPGVDGKVPVAEPLPRPVNSVSVRIGGVLVTPLYAGAAPTLVSGVLQVIAVIPNGVATGDQVPIVLETGGKTSISGVTVAIR